MKGPQLFLVFNLLLISFLGETAAAESERNGVYIVYMGDTHLPNGAPRNDHAQLLRSLTNRKKNAVLHTYSHGFLGFAARLSDKEAKSIAKRPGVVSVFPDPVLHLHTTRSWDFLKDLDSTPKAPTDSSLSGEDTIIGFLDTGIWPESESFNDKDMGPIPSRWKGTCMEGENFTSSNCNRKIIGARYYADPELDTPGTPRDNFGHGSHVASTAAGRPVSGPSYYGLAKGTTKGGSPGSRIAMYCVCPNGDCTGSAILKGYDDAIADGVDVLSVSLGSSSPVRFSDDPVIIGAFHATKKGITVVCAAGNHGPSSATVDNAAPWIITVAATTIDRDFESDVVLGGNKVIKGGAINFSDLNKSPVYPLIDGFSARLESSQQGDDGARTCNPGSLDGDKVKGKIVLCENKVRPFGTNIKYDMLKDQGVVGMILIDDNSRRLEETYTDFPVTAVTEEDGAEILSYINSSSDPVATILPTVVIPNYKPAPVVALFSSRGPVFGVRNLLKPDIAAPGQNILAAWSPNSNELTVPGREPPLYGIVSGTSMACPHVSGLAAVVKSQHPTWSSSAIRSAIMTTGSVSSKQTLFATFKNKSRAYHRIEMFIEIRLCFTGVLITEFISISFTAIQTNNVDGPITAETGSEATPYDIGAGEISLSGALQPGLVYETETMDYILFLCNIGYNTSDIKLIASDLPVNFSCPVESSFDLVSNMNYPSIAVSLLQENDIKTVNRTVTNVGEDESIYTPAIEAPAGVDVQVVPDQLEFTRDVKKLTFEVTFNKTAESQEDLFGSITWCNEKYKVRSPFVVSNA
ncbi:CO(2)-response secreted protease [Sesamum alatum]|uniref:CO(2)-response secreted protease n=1 Tax=Sesamum alatum TaxID=300844 RepID=A0AAE2CUJ3_9LAMI|nr:CO(2)-response secreted protease [Sesamum alatum]